MLPVNYWVSKLGLLPHPEGGYYKENYRSSESISVENLPGRFENKRNVSTAIYFLIEKNNFSALHKIKSDEVWHFYYGDPLDVYYFDKNKELVRIKLGQNPEQEELMQAVVPADCWFGSRLSEGSNYCLVGCTVAPGFDFTDFEMAERSKLIEEYPNYESIITQLTR